MPEAALPGDLRAVLAALDPGETAVLPEANALVMLCARSPASDVPPSRDDIAGNLLNGKLGLLALAYQEELRANANIKIQ